MPGKCEVDDFNGSKLVELGSSRVIHAWAFDPACIQALEHRCATSERIDGPQFVFMHEFHHDTFRFCDWAKPNFGRREKPRIVGKTIKTKSGTKNVCAQK